MATSAKQEVRRVLDALPDDASWDDVHYALYILDLRRRGLKESAAGKKRSHEEARKYLGLSDR